MFATLLALILSPVEPIRNLASEDFATRQRAVRTLRVAGVRAVPALVVVSYTGDVEQRRTASRLLNPYRVAWERAWLQWLAVWILDAGDFGDAYEALPMGSRYGTFQVLAEWGLVHPLEPFDVCSDLDTWGSKSAPDWIRSARWEWNQIARPSWYYRVIAR